MKTAVQVEAERANPKARQRLYRLSEPLDGHSHVVVSAADVPGSGPETYIFGADETGEITEWCELTGSYRGDLDHERALRNAGYDVVTVG